MAPKKLMEKILINLEKINGLLMEPKPIVELHTI